MAENRTINIDINQNAEEAAKGFNKLNDALDETNKSVGDVNKTFEEVYGELQPLTTRLGEAEDRLYELALAGQTTTQEYQDLLRTVANYRQVQIQTDAVVDAASTRFDEKLGGALQGAASGFAGVQGAMALMGTESEALEKTLVKLQGAMALAEAVRGIREGVTSFKALGMQGKAAFQGMTTAGKAFAVTGIGLLITGVGLLISKMGDLAAKEKEYAEARRTAFDESLLAFEKEAELSQARAELQGKSEREMLKMQLATLKEKNERLRRAANEEYEIYEKAYSAERRSWGLRNAGAKESYEKHVELNKQQQETVHEINLLQVRLEKATRDELKNIKDKEIEEDKKRNEEAKRLAKERYDKAKATRDAELSELRGYIKEADKLYSQSQMDETEKAIDEIKRKYEQQLKLAKKYKKGIAEIETAMMNEINDIRLVKVNEQIAQEQAAREQARLNRIAQENQLWSQIEAIAEQNYQRTLTEQEKEILAVNDKYFELETLAQGNAEQLAIIEEAKEGELYDINKKYSDKKKADKKAEIESITNMTLQGLDLIASIAEANAGEDEKRQRAAFNIRKASNIAQATVDGYKAVLSTYADTPGGIVVKTIAATIAGGFAALKIGQIAKSKYESSASGGGNDLASGGTESFAPQFNVIGNSGINQLAQLTQQPVQAYVVSGEVTSAQALDRNRQKNATL